MTKNKWSIGYTDAIAALNDRLHSSGASLDSIWSGNDPDIEDSDEPRQYLLELIGIHQSWTLVEIVGLEGLIPIQTVVAWLRRHNEAVCNRLTPTEGQARTTLQDSLVSLSIRQS